MGRQEYRDKKLAYYESPNAPPSANPMEWKRQKRKNDPDAQGKKPDIKQSQKGVSWEKHAPTRREGHKFERKRIRG